MNWLTTTGRMKRNPKNPELSRKGKIAGNQDKFDRSISELNQMYTDVKYFHYN